MTCHWHSSIQIECIGGAGVGDLHFFVADVTKLFDALRRKIFDCALGRLASRVVSVRYNVNTLPLCG